ncbi:hypothetical protein MHYP_G00077310 [Metynnis hypsauchen]
MNNEEPECRQTAPSCETNFKRRRCELLAGKVNYGGGRKEKSDKARRNRCLRRRCEEKPPSLSCRVTLIRPAPRTESLSGFATAYGTKPKWQLQRRGGAARVLNRKRRTQGPLSSHSLIGHQR